jgi:HK97 family phage major capsid protein
MSLVALNVLPPVAGGAPEIRSGGSSNAVPPKVELAQLKAEKSGLVDEIRALKGKLEKRTFAPEDEARVSAIETRLGQIDARVQALEAAAAQDAQDDQMTGQNGAPKAGETRSAADRLAALEARFAQSANQDLEARLAALERVANGNPIQRRSDPIPAGLHAPNYTADLDDKGAERVHSEAFRGWCGAPKGIVTRSQAEAMTRLGVDGNSDDLRVRIDPRWVRSGERDRDIRNQQRAIEQRTALQIGNTGAYLAPTVLMETFIAKMVAYNKLRDFCQVFQTADGNAMTYPTFDDTANLATIVTDENTDRGNTDLTVGQGTFSTSEINSDIALFSYKLLRDSYFDVETLAGNMLGMRVGRKQSALYTTGTGSGQPQGVVTGASAGATAASSSAIAYNDIVNLMMSLDDAYDDGASFAFNKASVLAALLKLADSQSRPLFANVVDGIPRTLLGKPIILLYSMANIATGNVSMLYGNFQEGVMIREVGDLIISRSTEYKWIKRQVALTADFAGDCRVVQSAAIKKLTHP